MDSIEIYEEGQYPAEFNLLEDAEDTIAKIAEFDVDELADIYPDEYDLLGEDMILYEDYPTDEEELDDDDDDDVDDFFVESDLEIDPEEDVPEVEADDPVLDMLGILDDIADLECQLETAQNSDPDNFSDLEIEERQIIEELIYEKNDLLTKMENDLSEDDLEIWLDVVKEKPLKAGMLKNNPQLKLDLALQMQALAEETDAVEALARKEHRRDFMVDDVAEVTADIRLAEELYRSNQIDLSELKAFAADAKASLAAAKAEIRQNRARGGRIPRPTAARSNAAAYDLATRAAAQAQREKKLELMAVQQARNRTEKSSLPANSPRTRRPTVTPRLEEVQQAQRRASVRRVSLMVQARSDAAQRSRSISTATAASRPKTAVPRPRRAPIVIPARIDPAAENRRRVRRIVIARNNYAQSTQAYADKTVPETEVSEADKKKAIIAKVKKIQRVKGVQIARKAAADKKNRDAHAEGTVPRNAVIQAEKKAAAIVQQAQIERKVNIKIARDRATAKAAKHVDGAAPVSPRIAAMKVQKATVKKEEKEKIAAIVAARRKDVKEFADEVAPVSARAHAAAQRMAAREMARANRVSAMVESRKVERKEFSTAKVPKTRGTAVVKAEKKAAEAQKVKEEAQALILIEARKKWSSKEKRSAYAKEEAVVSPRVAAMMEEKAEAKKEEVEKLEKKVAARKVDAKKFAEAKVPQHAKATAAIKLEKQRKHEVAKIVEMLKESKKQYSKKEYVPKVKRPVVTALKPNRGPIDEPTEGQASYSTRWALKRLAEQEAELAKTRRNAEMLAQAANKFSLPHRRNSELTRAERTEALSQQFALENMKRQAELQAELDWLKEDTVVEDIEFEDEELDEFAQFEREERLLAGE